MDSFKDSEPITFKLCKFKIYDNYIDKKLVEKEINNSIYNKQLYICDIQNEYTTKIDKNTNTINS